MQNHHKIQRFVTDSEEFAIHGWRNVGLKWWVHFSFIKFVLQVQLISYLKKIPNYEILYHKIASVLFSRISSLRILVSTLFPKIIIHHVTRENRLKAIQICSVLIFPVYALEGNLKYLGLRRTYNFYFFRCLQVTTAKI